MSLGRISKKLPVLLACLIAVVTCASMVIPSVYGKSTDKVLMVGVPADRIPIFYKESKTGEVKGIGVDLMRSAAEEAGYEVSFKPIGEKNLRHALDNETYDLVMPFGSVLRSASGKKSIVSDSLMQTPFTLVTLDNNGREMPPINRLRVGMLQSLGAVSETVLQLYPGVKINLYDNMDASMKALREGEVDALLNNSYVWSYVLQKPAYSDLAVHPSAVFSLDFRVGTLDTPADRDIIKRLNSGISKLTDDRRDEIISNYTSRSLYEYDFSDYIHQYGFICLLCVVVIIAMTVFLWSRTRN